MEVGQQGTEKLQSSTKGVSRGRGAPSVGAGAGRKLRRRGNAGLMGEAGQIVMRMETVGAAFEGRF